MKRIFLFFVLSVIFTDIVWCVPAYPFRVKVKAEGGFVYITLKGDEKMKYGITESGYTILPDSSGWCYACKDEKGNVCKSDIRLRCNPTEDADIASFLSKVPKGLVPDFVENDSTTSNRISAFPERSKAPVIGKRKILIVLMQFPDLRFIKSASEFDNLFNGENYYQDGAYGSVHDYYKKVSYGKLDLQCDVIGPFTTARNASYYGENKNNGDDKNPYAMFEEAIKNASKEVNLHDYDSDGDGFVDNVHIIYSGHGEEAGAPTYSIWAHECTFSTIVVDGMKIDRYSCSPELRSNTGNGITRIGPPCHEIGHALGANDYYDVNYQTGGYYEGTGKWDIMASGSWNDSGARPADFNPYVKIHDFGWIEPVVLERDSIVELQPSFMYGDVIRINTPVENDFYLLENRVSSGVTGAEPGTGMLIFHVGPEIVAKSRTNTINATYPQQCYVVCASSNFAIPRALPSTYGDISSDGCPYPGTRKRTSFSSASTPAACCVDGTKVSFSVNAIKEMDSDVISFAYSTDYIPPVLPGDEDEKDDTGGDDADPDENLGYVVWNDDFEDIMAPSKWTDEVLEGQATWVKLYNKLNVTDKNPLASSGIAYMALLSSTSGIEDSSTKIQRRLVSPNINIGDECECYITGKFRVYDTKKLPTDTLKVLIGNGENGKWDSIGEFSSIVRNQWIEFVKKISVDSVFQIALEGSMRSDAIIFVDDIRILRDDTTSGISKVDLYESSQIYTIEGKYIGANMNIMELPSGLYLQKTHTGTKKIYIRR